MAELTLRDEQLEAKVQEGQGLGYEVCGVLMNVKAPGVKLSQHMVLIRGEKLDEKGIAMIRSIEPSVPGVEK
jgi:hypothetical protein